MIPIIILGICFGVIIKVSLKDASNKRTGSSTIVGSPTIDFTPHLTEFAQLIRRGHRPNRWLINEAVREAFQSGDWALGRTISDSFPSDTQIERRKKKIVEEKKEESTEEPSKEESEPQKLLDFRVEKTTSPVDGIPDDDWRMFVQASNVESPDFESETSRGMFRQNKKRISKLGVPVTTPVEQYAAFENEVMNLMEEGRDIIKQSVAMPIDVDGETLPITLSGLLSVMRNAGVSGASKWLDSADERKRFPNTTGAFKSTNGCF